MAGIFALTWVTTRFLSKRLPGGGRTGHMQIIEKLSLGKDRQVALVKVGEEHFMIGVAGQQISFSPAIRLNQPEMAETSEDAAVSTGITDNDEVHK